ncbi:MAG TPA: glycosyltransferase family 9 protein, partial [Candidatus Limnocylindrales bacterium]|nr:glycosyltransferase family 9 protein [Candidatus Limnocylindrales bacterium]
MTTPRTFLIVSLRYNGDVLLSTPLARSIRAEYPEAAVDYLVFEGTEGILARNPDVRNVFTVRPGSRSLTALLGRWKEYDVSIGVNASDRTAFQLIAAGRRSIGFADPRPKEWWKRRLFSHCSTYDPERHVVELLLGQLRYLLIRPIPEVSIHFGEEALAAAREAAGAGDFLLLHPYTRWEYKKWPSAHWAGLCRRIEEATGERALFTVAPGGFEGRIREEILEAGIRRDRFVSRELPLTGLAALVSLAKAYVGVDTVVTHMAAALGRPTVAIFGPTPPHRWGPWPNGHPLAAPYVNRGGIQRNGNIVIVQKDW